MLWLEDYLVTKCKSTVVVVSHDRAFLNHGVWLHI